MPDKIAAEHSKRTDAAYDGPAVVYFIDPAHVTLRKMPPPRFTSERGVLCVNDPAPTLSAFPGYQRHG